MWTNPVCRSLVAELQPWVTELPADALLFPAWGVVGSDRKASIRPETSARRGARPCAGAKLGRSRGSRRTG